MGVKDNLLQQSYFCHVMCTLPPNAFVTMGRHRCAWVEAQHSMAQHSMAQRSMGVATSMDGEM
jgi:hypothetical protein